MIISIRRKFPTHLLGSHKDLLMVAGLIFRDGSESDSITEVCPSPRTWVSASEECMFSIELDSEAIRTPVSLRAQGHLKEALVGVALYSRHAILGSQEDLLRRPDYKLWQS